MAQSVYVSHQANGDVVAINGKKHKVDARIKTAAGITQLKAAPESRLLFGVNPESDELYVIDASMNKLVQVGDMESRPVEINFSDELIYILHENSETVLMVSLANVGVEGVPIQIVDFPGGQEPAGRGMGGTNANGIVKAPGISGMLIANPSDESIYYYMEGMAAPMGEFSNYGKNPLAVNVVDKSFKEVGAGVYSTTAILRRSGTYDLAFFLDAPRIVECFPIKVKENPELAEERALKRFGSMTVGLQQDLQPYPSQRRSQTELQPQRPHHSRTSERSERCRSHVDDCVASGSRSRAGEGHRRKWGV